jgi:hypothetical protein
MLIYLFIPLLLESTHEVIDADALTSSRKLERSLDCTWGKEGHLSYRCQSFPTIRESQQPQPLTISGSQALMCKPGLGPFGVRRPHDGDLLATEKIIYVHDDTPDGSESAMSLSHKMLGKIPVILGL